MAHHILHLPRLVLERIIGYLSVKEVSNIRSTCKEFLCISSSKSIVDRLKIFIDPSFQPNEVESLTKFLTENNYGQHLRIHIVDPQLPHDIVSNIAQAAKHISEFSGSIHLLEQISLHCKDIRRLSLALHEDPIEAYNEIEYQLTSVRKTEMLNSFLQLRTLNISPQDRSSTIVLPVTFINNITSCAPSLEALGFSHVWFEIGNEMASLTQTVINNRPAFVYCIKCEHVKKWSFVYALTASRVGGLGVYKLLLPPSISLLRLISSPDVVWDSTGDELQELYVDGDEVLLDERLGGSNLQKLTLACVRFSRTMNVGVMSQLTTLSLLNCNNVHNLLRQLSGLSSLLAHVLIYCSRGAYCRDPFCASSFTIATREIVSILTLFPRLSSLTLGGFSHTIVEQFIVSLTAQKTQLNALIVEDCRPMEPNCSQFHNLAKDNGASFRMLVFSNNGELLHAYIEKLFYLNMFDDERRHCSGCVCNLCQQHSHDCELIDGVDGTCRNIFPGFPQ